MGYCWTCGWHTDAMTAPADLDPDSRMCRWCRDNWRPAGDRPGDLGTRNPHACARSAGQAADLRLLKLIVAFPHVSTSSKLGPGQA